MRTNPRVIGIPVLNSVYFSSASKLAGRLKSSGKFQPVIIFSFEIYRPELKKLLLLRTEGVDWIGLENSQGGLPSKIIAVLASRILWIDFLSHLFGTVRFRRWLKRAIKAKCLEMFLLPADNRYLYPQMTALAKSNGIPVALFPSWFANESELVSVFSDSPIYTSGLMFGKWSGPWKNYIKFVKTKNTVRKPMIPFPKSEILTRVIFGAEVPNPWILNSSKADIILVETQTAFDYAKRLGFDEDQLKLTGSMFLDEMFHAQEQEKFLRAGASPRETLIVCALPPNMFDYPVARGLEFNNYNELVSSWCEALNAIPDANVIVALHPTSSKDLISQVKAHGLQVSSEETHILISRADLYIACISATIQWAISSRVPTVNYDVYGFAYPDYTGHPLVTEVCTFSKFKNLLVTGTRELIAKGSKNSRHVSDLGFNELDGQSGQRIITAIDNLLTKSDISLKFL